MKSSQLGEFQEIVLLVIMLLDEQAYGVSIQEEIEKRTNRKISRGALHTALTRLTEKGFVASSYGGATNKRGGRRKRYYQVTKLGTHALQEAKRIREELWSLLPQLNFNI